MVTRLWASRACLPRLSSSLPSCSALSGRRALSTRSRFFQVSEEVQQAIAEHRPVVALESTIYTHGFPYPDNLSLASRLESLVRVNGGVPATIGILDGAAHVGMGAEELIRLVSAAGKPNMLKLSRRDLGFACGLTGPDGKPFYGGTTIAATMLLAHKAGIRVFATGGLGGVHRGAEQTMDVSADLTELGRTPVAVISSGCKAFLDILKTLEYLETQGVAVATFLDGREGSVDFPAFWTRESGVKSPMALRDEDEAARVLYAHMELGLQSGLHFANPIPAQYSIPLTQMQSVIEEAIREAHAAGASGSAETPYILNKIKELTGSKSVEANRALVEANVIRGTKVAVALKKLEMEGIREADRPEQLGDVVTGPASVNYTSTGVSEGVSAPSTLVSRSSTTPSTPQHDPTSTADEPAKVFIAGSLNVDLSCDFSPRPGSSAQSPELQTSNPAVITQSLGGVAANVARAAHLMGTQVRLCSAVGDDLMGRAALDALAANQMSAAGVKILPTESGSRTSQYIAVNDRSKDLVLAMADVSILEQRADDSALVSAFESFWLPQLREAHPSHIVIDANWSPPHLARWLQVAQDIGAHVTFEPVSTSKSAGIFQLPKAHTLSTYPKPLIHLATPNAHELASMYSAARSAYGLERQDWWEVIDALGIPHSGARVQMALATSSELVDEGIPQQSIQLLPFIPCICTKLGKHGVLVTQLLPAGDPRLTSAEYAPHILSRCANESEQKLNVGGVYMRLFPAVEEVRAEDVVSVNGVGDTFAGTLVAGWAARGRDARVEDLVDLAQRAAVLTLKSEESVSPGLGTLRILL